MSIPNIAELSNAASVTPQLTAKRPSLPRHPCPSAVGVRALQQAGAAGGKLHGAQAAQR